MGLTNFSGSSSGSNNPSGGSSGGPFGSAVPQQPDAQAEALENLVDYNTKFKNSSPILFRDAASRQVESILIGKKKPNALLIGSAGVGKTRIVEDLARRIEAADPTLPDGIAGSHIYELPLSAVISGTIYRGQMEARLRNIIQFLSDPANKAIVFIDEIHQLCGHSESYEEIAQILKPALARGDIRCIGATTLQEVNQLMDDPALSRRFSRVIIEEFTQEQTVKILQDMKGEFFSHYGMKISLSDDLMETVVRLADEYRPSGSHRPDNAITLLDRAMGDVAVERKIAEHAASADPAMLAAFRSVPVVPLREDQVKRTAMKLMTGGANKSIFDEGRVRAALSVIRGQDKPVDAVVTMLRRQDMALFRKNTPLTLLFAGSSGVGKTEVVKIIAQELTGLKPITLNMTEYHSSASINRIIGAPVGYIGSDSNAELPFDCLESNPYQVILLDEFEKCDRSVQRLFMSVFDEGYIKTNRGGIIDFSRSIIVATTNAGHAARRSAPLGFNSSVPGPNKSESVKTLSGYFDTELLNRFDAILTFNALSKNDFKAILQDIYTKEAARIMKEKPRITLLPAIPDGELDRIADEEFVPEFGARPCAKAARGFIESQV